MTETNRQRSRAALIRLARSVRELIDVTVTIDAEPEALDAAADRVDRLVAELRPMVPDRPLPRFEGPSAGLDGMFPYDYVLGRCNPIAAPINVEWQDPKAIGTATFGTPYEGPPGCVHGGVIAAAFDQVLGLPNMVGGMPGPTAKLELRYRRPTPLHTPLRFETWRVRSDGRRAMMAGRLLAGGVVTVEAKAVYVSVPFDRMMRMSDPNP